MVRIHIAWGLSGRGVILSFEKKFVVVDIEKSCYT